MQLTKYGPKSGVSPTIGDPCPLCGDAFARGDFTTLVRTSIQGKYANDAVEVHWERRETLAGGHGRASLNPCRTAAELLAGCPKDASIPAARTATSIGSRSAVHS
jgi:hypothetical protein